MGLTDNYSRIIPMKSLIRFFAAPLLGLSMLCACQSQTSDATPSDKVVLGFQKSARLASGLTVRVDSLTDSRCPTGVTCVWAGQAVAAVTINAGTDAQTRRLVLEPGQTDRRDSTTVLFDNVTYKVILREVIPYPVGNERPEQQAIIQIARL